MNYENHNINEDHTTDCRLIVVNLYPLFVLTRISSFCLVSHTIEWLRGHSSGNRLLRGHQCWKPSKPSKLSIPKTKPYKSGDHTWGQCCYGHPQQPTSGNVPLVWLYLRTPSAVPEVLKKHIHLHSAGDAKFGSQWATSQGSKAEKWSCSVRHIYAHGTFLDICVWNFYQLCAVVVLNGTVLNTLYVVLWQTNFFFFQNLQCKTHLCSRHSSPCPCLDCCTNTLHSTEQIFLQLLILYVILIILHSLCFTEITL